jgi:hypothetical protein
VLDQDTCDQPSHFAVYDARALAASAMLPSAHVWCWYPGSIRPAGAHQPFCPARDERDVAFGVLGRHTVSVTYRVSGGGLRTVPVTSDYGAYLIVLRQPPLSQPLNGSLSSSSFPFDRFPLEYQPSALTSIRLRFGGHVCQTGDAAALIALADRPPVIAGSAAPWLLTIARNSLIDSYRRGRRRRASSMTPSSISTAGEGVTWGGGTVTGTLALPSR